jgi:mono/diheme cytochrome c family protein
MAAPFHVVFMLSGMQSMNARVGFWVSAFGALFVATLLVVTGSGFAAEGSSTAASSDPAQIAKGKALYGTNCLHCHGINMVTPGTAAFDLREFPHDDKARFVNSVTHGKNNRMPPWGDVLKPEDIDNLWAYVLTGGKP